MGENQKENVHLGQMMRCHAEVRRTGKEFHSLLNSTLKSNCCSSVLNTISLGESKTATGSTVNTECVLSLQTVPWKCSSLATVMLCVLFLSTEFIVLNFHVQALGL